MRGTPARILTALVLVAAASLTNVGPVAAMPRGAPASATPRPPGYWLVAADGGVFSYGGAPFAGSAGAIRLAAPIVGMAATPTGRGYWLVAADGGVFTYGDAVFAGSTGNLRLRAPIVGIAATPTGRGYWMVAGDGGVFGFGDATFFGSAVDPGLKGSAVAIVGTGSGAGYWVVTSEGQVVAFGDAGWHGDAVKVVKGGPIVAAAATSSGRGYWLAGSDGGILTYGDAPFAGSAGALHLQRPIVGVTATPTGGGYWLVASDGGVFSYGDAPFAGSAGALRLSGPIAGLAALPAHRGTGVVTFFYPWYATPTQDGAWRHWDEGGHTPPDDIGSDYYPVRGAYSSTDPAILNGQMADIAAAGIDEIVTSWWGQGSFEDHALSSVLTAAAAHGVRVAVHLEPYQGRTALTIDSDLTYLASKGVTEAWIYEAMQLPSDQLAAALDQHPGDFLLAETGDVRAVESGAFAQWASSAHFRAVYTYDAVRYEGIDQVAFCASARRYGLGCVTGVAPGFSAIRVGGSPSYARSRDNGATYDWRWMGAIGAHPDEIAVVTFNEWHEGTQIEPAMPKCLSSTFCYANFDGAYGLMGQPATTAYLGRTRVWAARYRAASP